MLAGKPCDMGLLHQTLAPHTSAHAPLLFPEDRGLAPSSSSNNLLRQIQGLPTSLELLQQFTRTSSVQSADSTQTRFGVDAAKGTGDYCDKQRIVQSSLEDVTADTVKECGFSMTQRYTKRSPLIEPQLLSGSSQVPQERPQLFRSTVSDDADSTATKRLKTCTRGAALLRSGRTHHGDTSRSHTIDTLLESIQPAAAGCL
eukprot:jgi/Astpho2/8724/Aster-05288